MSQNGGVYGDKGRFFERFFFLLSIEIVSRRHMIHILVLMYLFYLRVVYVRGRHYVFIVFIFLVSHMVY